MKNIYLDNCITSQPTKEVIDAMLPYFTEKFHYPGNFIKNGTRAGADVDQWKNIVANSLNANEDEIHFTSGGTTANNIAIKGLLMQNADKGTHIICSVIDYPDVLTNVSFFEKSGFEVTYLPTNWDGLVDPEDLKNAIRPDTVLFITTLVNHTVGTVQPVLEYRKVLNEADHKIFMHVDAAQGYGRMKIDVQEIGADTLTISAHKIHGPQGVGALFVKKGIQLAQIHHGIRRVDNFNTGGVSIAGLAGFAKAVEQNFNDLDSIIQDITAKRDYLYKSIREKIPYIILNGSYEQRISHNLNVTFEYIEGEAIMMMLNMYGITVATGSACASQGLSPNYIMMAMGRTHEQSHGSIKFTLSRFTTKEELDYTVEKLSEIVKTLRERSPLYDEEKLKEENK
jgi:cysteine desulfurase